MTDAPGGNDNRPEAAPHADLIRNWEAMTDKQRREAIEADLFHSVLTEGFTKLREVFDALPAKMLRDEVMAAIGQFGGPSGHWVPFVHVNDEHEEGIVVEIRATTPEGFNRATNFDRSGNDFIRVAMIRLATI